MCSISVILAISQYLDDVRLETTLCLLYNFVTSTKFFA